MDKAGKDHLQAHLALVIGVLGLGFSGIFVSWANAPGAVTGFYRMAIALLVLAAPFYRRIKAIGRIPAAEVKIALAAGFFFAGDLMFWNSGILISGATNPTLMGNTAPIWVGLGALIFFRERQAPLFWAGLLLSFTGAAVILGIDAARDVGLGTFYGLLAGIFYGGYYLVMQRSRQRLDALTSFWLSGASAAAVLLIGALLMRQPLTGYSSTTYLNFLGLGLLVQVGGQLAINFALGYLPASVVSSTMLGQPVLTALLAVPFLGERLSSWQIAGGVAVVIGVLTVHRSRIRMAGV